MSCHISALCIALPCPKRGPAETTLGRGIHGGWRRRPSRPLSKHQQHLSLSLHPAVAGGHLLSRAPSTSLPQFLTKKEEFSTYPSSGLCWRDTQHVEEEACTRATYFQVSVATQCPPWRIGSQTRIRCFVASPVRSAVGAKSLSARSSQKGYTPKSLIVS